MKNVYFVQANSYYGGEICLPYSAGVLASYAWSFEEIKSRYCLKRIVYKREDIDSCVLSLNKPYLVCFSCYIWSLEYNKALARRIKEKYPDCLILFGGHSVDNDSPCLLEEYGYIDLLIHNEGEVPFYRLLSALGEGKSLEGVPNLSFRRNGRIYKTENELFDVTDFPSPYSAGIFDPLIAAGTDRFYGILETNRGCPYDCIYCDWGNHAGHIRLFPLERIRADIAWMSSNKLSYCLCADANFGILERDKEIADYFIGNKKLTGYPSKIQFCFAKNSNDAVFEINRKMNDSGMSKGATVSLQTLSPDALSAVGRQNMPFEKYTELIRRYSEQSIPTYTDVILGLPGETLDTFINGIERLFEAGQHTSINVFNCELLINSRLGQKEAIEKYKIRTAACALNRHHSDSSDAVPETNTVIISTASMSSEDWINANMFVACTGCFHNLGLLQYIAIYLFAEKKVSYADFYKALLKRLETMPGTLAGTVFADIHRRLSDVVNGRGICEYFLPGFGDVNWPLEEGAFLQIVFNEERFRRETEDFLASFGIADDIFKDLCTYQRGVLKLPGRSEHSFSLHYDFPEYFASAKRGVFRPLAKKELTVTVKGAQVFPSAEDYARETVWYGRKGGQYFYSTEMTVEYN